MVTCTFCGYDITPGTGKMYVKKDAKILWFCSRRCEKNLLKLGRNPRTTTFTADAKKAKKQLMAAHAHAEAKKHEHAPEAEAKPAKAKSEAKPKKAPAKKAAAKDEE
jgi:large subunit ribosomal protein L24e